jgi:hypothetical protein
VLGQGGAQLSWGLSRLSLAPGALVLALAAALALATAVGAVNDDTVLVSRAGGPSGAGAGAGAGADELSSNPSTSADGRFVAFRRESAPGSTRSASR